MSGTVARFKKPDMSLRDAVAAAKEHEKGQKGVRKQFTSIRTKDASDGAAYGSGICRPTDDELAVINTFTRSPKTADEVAVFSTLSCNDLEDRDVDKFTTQTVKDFAALPAPYGPVGKSFMVGHDYKKLPVGRIFEADTTKVNGATFLTNKVYLPNTEQHKDFIENQDFGIYWAVSVGVMLEENKCSVCEAHMSSWGGYCFAGHVKGMYYPKGDEGDPGGWDFATPVDEGTKGAVKCIGIMEGAKDFYELSQVFLGAQFYAEIGKSPGMKGIMKAASGPVVNLGAEERKALPFQHVPDKVTDATQSYETSTDEDGRITWTDDKGLAYEYDPTTSEVLCLGKTQAESQEDDDGEGDLSAAEGEQELPGDGAEEQREVGQEADLQRADAGDGDGSSSDSDAAESSGSDGSVDDSSNNEQEDDVDKQAVLAAAKRVGLPAVMLSALAEAEDCGLDAVLRSAVERIAELEGNEKSLKAKAEIGDTYLKDMTADAINWYVKAHQDGENKGVSTDTFERLLAACGDNIDLVKALREEQVNLAQAKFPASVRRSSFPDDPNARQTMTPVELPAVGGDSDKRVSRLHG